MYGHHCNCDPHLHCSHRPHGWVPPPRPPTHFAGNCRHRQHQKHIPPPPGPGKVIPASALPKQLFKPSPVKLENESSSKAIPPPPGPGKVIPGSALPKKVFRPTPVKLQNRFSSKPIPSPPGPGAVIPDWALHQSPQYQHAGPPPSYVPPPPGPGQVIPDWALPRCGHSSHNHGCSHCSSWQWR